MNDRTPLTALGLALLAAGMLAAATGTAEPLRVLILSGKNVHDWTTTTPELQRIYAGCRRFNGVDVSNDPAACTTATLAAYDVVVCNWTAHPEMHGHPWGEVAEKAISDFVRGGKGFVAFHAASTAYYDWPEFQQMVGLTWKWQFTSHTAYATFKVAIEDHGHPMTRGLTDFWTTDELYQNMVTLSDAGHRLLCQAFARADIGGTGRFESMLIATRLGQGRAVNLLLGHDVAAMRNAGFRTLLLRGTEWAGSEEVTIPMPADWPGTAAAAAVTGLDADAMLRAVAGYTFGQPRLALSQLEQYIIATYAATDPDGLTRRQQLAANIAARLGTGIAPEAKAFLCRQLAAIATEEQVPAVAALLLDPSTSDAARTVLERIPGQGAGQALRQALGQATGTIRLGIVNSLGNRGDAEAVELLGVWLTDADDALATVTAAALGKIGTGQAVEALEAAWDQTSGRRREALADALLACADRLGVSQWHRLEAYAPTRAAAWRQTVRTSPAKANDLVAQALAGEDRALRSMALRAIRELPREIETVSLAGQVATLPPETAGLVLIALADRGDKAALPAVLGAANQSHAAVRVAALRAVGDLGNAANVPFLAERALSPDQAERTAALLALVVLRGPEVDAGIVRLLESATPEAKVALLRSLAARGARQARGAVLEAAGDRQDTVRLEAWLALEELAGVEDLPALARLLARAGNAEREAAEQTVMAVARLAAAVHPEAVSAALRELRAAAEPMPIVERLTALGVLAGKPRNLALGAVASSPDGLEADGASSGDQAGIDGEPATYWDETDNQALYRFRVTFAQPTAVNALNLKGHAYRSHSPRDFEIVCDDAVVKAVRNADYDKATNEYFARFPRTTCRALELKITGYYGGSPGIRELEVYDLPASPPAD